jgi:hypothetical protein
MLCCFNTTYSQTYILTTDVKTPNNHIVQDTWELTSSDVSYTPDQLSAIAADLFTNYNGAELIDPPSYKYNCHGYAWNVSEGGNKVWIGRYTITAEDIYWTDESYIEVAESIATKVSYHQDGNHSAIRLNSTWYQSKWGWGGPLVKHHPNDVLVIYKPNLQKKYYIRPTISGSSQICTQETYTIENFPGATVAWSATPTGIVSCPPTGNPVTVTKLTNGNITLTAVINNIYTITKNISVSTAPYSLYISSYSNLTMWDANDFQVLPGSGYYAYEGTLSLSDGVGLATSYGWSFVSSTTGKPVSWWPNGGSVDVAMKQVDTNLTLKCTASNGCGSYYQYYTFTTGDIIPMIITPNPSSTQVEVSVPDAVTTNSVMSTATENLSVTSYSVTVVDSYGLTVYTATKTDKKFSILTSSFRNGIYAVIVSDGTNVYQKKLIVKH